MRIGILTFHRANNCGAMLQAWALKIVLERMDHKVEFPDCNDIGYVPCGLHCLNVPKEKTGLLWWRSFIGRAYLDLIGKRMGNRRAKLYNAFRRKMLPERHCIPSQMTRYFDLVVVGSDQVFSLPHIGKYKGLFFGTELPASLPRIAYAASQGENSMDEQDRLEFDEALSHFKAVSFRESYKDYKVVSDPTLLLGASDYSAIVPSEPLIDGDFIYMYSVYMSDFEVKSARGLAKKLGLRLVVSPVYQDERTVRMLEVVDDLSPDLMIRYIRDAKYVLAGSFHAAMMAFIFHKPFLAFRQDEDPFKTRVGWALSRFGLVDRLINPGVSVDQMVATIKSPMPESAYDKANAFSGESLAWLRSHIA